MSRYYFDSATQEESLYGSYTFVIRDRLREGWVFRFAAGDVKHADDVMRGLNYPKVLAA